MPGDKKKKLDLPDGSTGTGVEVRVVSSKEEFSTFVLEDKTTIRLRPVVTAIHRVEGQYDESGQPVYLVNFQTIMAVTAPDDLRKKG